MNNSCIKCGNKLTKDYKSKKYCSKNCSKLYLKSEYKKRNKEKVNAYNRLYKSTCSRRPLNKTRRYKLIEERRNKCNRCGIEGNTSTLNTHHIKPLNKGGIHNRENLMILCFKCHMEWENRMSGYWI